MCRKKGEDGGVRLNSFVFELCQATRNTMLVLDGIESQIASVFISTVETVQSLMHPSVSGREFILSGSKPFADPENRPLSTFCLFGCLVLEK